MSVQAVDCYNAGNNQGQLNPAAALSKISGVVGLTRQWDSCHCTRWSGLVLLHPWLWGWFAARFRFQGPFAPGDALILEKRMADTCCHLINEGQPEIKSYLELCLEPYNEKQDKGKTRLLRLIETGKASFDPV